MPLFLLSLFFSQAAAGRVPGDALPSFFWSGRPYFQDNAHALETVPSAALSGIVSQLLGMPSASAELSQYVRATELQRGLPRVVVALLHRGLPALQSMAPDSVLASAIRSSASSLAVPHTYGADATDQPPLRAQVEGLAGTRASLVQLRDAEWLRTVVPAAAAPPRLLLVEAQGAELEAATIRRAFECIHNETAGNYVIMAAPLEAGGTASRAAARRLLGFPLPDDPFPMPATGDSNDGWACPYWEVYDPDFKACFRYIYITPNVLAAAAVVLFLLFVTGIALNCLAEVRTPPYLDMQVDEKTAKERARLIRGREF